jgi:copper chaperone CopZ
MGTVEIKIEGMTCGHCAMSITKELTAISGVGEVKVDHTAGKAEVRVDGVSNDQLADAIAEAGYKATGFVTLNA